MEQTDPPPEQDDHRPVILVIDDAPAAIEPIVDCLHRADFRTRIATTGERGLALARREPRTDRDATERAASHAIMFVLLTGVNGCISWNSSWASLGSRITT